MVKELYLINTIITMMYAPDNNDSVNDVTTNLIKYDTMNDARGDRRRRRKRDRDRDRNRDRDRDRDNNNDKNNNVYLSNRNKTKKKGGSGSSNDNNNLLTSYFEEEHEGDPPKNKIVYILSDENYDYESNDIVKRKKIITRSSKNKINNNSSSTPSTPPTTSITPPPPPPPLPPLQPPPTITAILMTGLPTLEDSKNNKDDNGGDDSDDDKKKEKERKRKRKTLICNNPDCDHKRESISKKPLDKINVKTINSVNDLILLGRGFHCQRRRVYNGLNLRILCNLIKPLTELNNIIGMKEIKKEICKQITFFLQGFNSKKDSDGKIISCGKCVDCKYKMPCIQNITDMMHTVITGAPGVGKTCVAKIIGKIYASMGILSKGTFTKVGLNDFIAEYVGQTGPKTEELIKKCTGGVMFIDEAYVMGEKRNPDTFCAQAMTILTEALSTNRDLLCIISGYKKDLDEKFFSMNEGLRRRFTFSYDIKPYEYSDLMNIFKQKIKEDGWSIKFSNSKNKGNDKQLLDLFRKHKMLFPYSGGDVETLFLQCKIVHGARMPQYKMVLSKDDIVKGFEQFIKHRKDNNSKKKDEELYRPSMYVLKK